MIDNLLSIQTWSAAVNGRFFKEIECYSNDEKCRITAAVAGELLKRGGNGNVSSAEVILTYATQKYSDVSDSNIKAEIYYLLGRLYEFHLENFIKAYTYYEKYALNNTVNDGSHSILLRALILRDDFTYSERLEKELRYSFGEQDLGLKNDRLYENLGRLILAKHENDEDTVKLLTKRLKAIVKADELFFLDFVFKKDTVPDSIRVPQKVIEYIKSL